MEGDAFVGNEDLNEAENRVRAPTDVRPYDESEDASFCFASRYTPGDDADPTDLGGDQLRTAFKQMNAIIDKHYGNNTSMSDLVEAVHTYYESEIRSHYDYGEWSRKSIYNYIMNYSSGAEDRQCSEGIKLLWSNIELLREHVAVQDSGGKTTPDLRIIKSLQESIKLHATLVDSKRKRPRTTPG